MEGMKFDLSDEEVKLIAGLAYARRMIDPAGATVKPSVPWKQLRGRL